MKNYVKCEVSKMFEFFFKKRQTLFYCMEFLHKNNYIKFEYGFSLEEVCDTCCKMYLGKNHFAPIKTLLYW